MSMAMKGNFQTNRLIYGCTEFLSRMTPPAGCPATSISYAHTKNHTWARVRRRPVRIIRNIPPNQVECLSPSTVSWWSRMNWYIAKIRFRWLNRSEWSGKVCLKCCFGKTFGKKGAIRPNEKEQPNHNENDPQVILCTSSFAFALINNRTNKFQQVFWRRDKVHLIFYSNDTNTLS